MVTTHGWLTMHSIGNKIELNQGPDYDGDKVSCFQQLMGAGARFLETRKNACKGAVMSANAKRR